MSRTPLIAGNWKLHCSVAQSVELARAVLHRAPRDTNVEIMVAPVFTALHAVHEALGDTGRISLGAQDVYWADEGPHTGEVSAPMLKDVGCTYVIVGHSERRARFHDTDDAVRQKVGAVLSHKLRPIVCIGETLAQREASETEAVVLGQLDAAVAGLDAAAMLPLVVAYEPVWAIGTGKTATPEDAESVHAAIRARVAETHGAGTAAALRILYGGSVKPANAEGLLRCENIDGALVGGAALTADTFVPIIEAAGA
ncbi:MAG: triose-phosphate isomerase [Sandaracinaceae bacterium]